MSEGWGTTGELGMAEVGLREGLGELIWKPQPIVLHWEVF